MIQAGLIRPEIWFRKVMRLQWPIVLWNPLLWGTGSFLRIFRGNSSSLHLADLLDGIWKQASDISRIEPFPNLPTKQAVPSPRAPKKDWVKF